jgi:segregation and condensation protein B
MMDMDHLPGDRSFGNQSLGEQSSVEVSVDTAAGSETAPPTSEVQLLGLIEASLFVSPEPISLKRLARAVGEDRDRVATLVETLAGSYEARASGLMIRQIAGGYQIATRPEHRQQLEAIVRDFHPAPLSLAALETLAAAIAYKQPIAASEIQAIRGVQGSGVLKTLLRRKLIAPAGRARGAGQAILFRTTKRFLVEFGLKDLTDLPPFEEFDQAYRFRFDPV